MKREEEAVCSAFLKQLNDVGEGKFLPELATEELNRRFQIEHDNEKRHNLNLSLYFRPFTTEAREHYLKLGKTETGDLIYALPLSREVRYLRNNLAVYKTVRNVMCYLILKKENDQLKVDEFYCRSLHLHDNIALPQVKKYLLCGLVAGLAFGFTKTLMTHEMIWLLAVVFCLLAAYLIFGGRLVYVTRRNQNKGRLTLQKDHLNYQKNIHAEPFYTRLCFSALHAVVEENLQKENNPLLHFDLEDFPVLKEEKGEKKLTLALTAMEDDHTHIKDAHLKFEAIFDQDENLKELKQI